VIEYTRDIGSNMMEQGRNAYFREMPYFQVFTVQWFAQTLLKLVEI
jgi:hypothetical protein